MLSTAALSYQKANRGGFQPAWCSAGHHVIWPCNSAALAQIYFYTSFAYPSRGYWLQSLSLSTFSCRTNLFFLMFLLTLVCIHKISENIPTTGRPGACPPPFPSLVRCARGHGQRQKKLLDSHTHDAGMHTPHKQIVKGSPWPPASDWLVDEV